MEKVSYRCGWCGQYTDNEGNPIGIPDENYINLKEELTHGNCCVDKILYNIEYEKQQYYNMMNEAYINGEI